MKTKNHPAFWRAGRFFTSGLMLVALGACSALRPTTTPPPAFYSLDSAQSTGAGVVPAPATSQAPLKRNGPTLIVNPPLAAAGFDSPRIIYVQEPHQLEYFAHSEWVDPPAQMLGPLLVTAIGHTGSFGAVVLTPGAAAGDLRLDTVILRLQQEFQTRPSRVRFTLRAVLVDDRTRRVLASRDFDGIAIASSDDPVGGVAAANRAVQTVLENLATFCVEAVGTGWMERTGTAK